MICWKIRIFAYWTTPSSINFRDNRLLWFAEKFVSLLIEQHQAISYWACQERCDLLKNSYLCLLNNTKETHYNVHTLVVICWKIRIFAYWTTPENLLTNVPQELWFAEKFVSLLIEQHQIRISIQIRKSCDLLKNSYLCLLNNTHGWRWSWGYHVVICWKIRIFAYWTTPTEWKRY